MMVSTGSGTVSLNTPGLSPAARNGTSTLSIMPEETMNGSVTTNGRARENFFSTSAIWPTVPPPTSIMRGAAMLAIVPVIRRSSVAGAQA